MKRRWKQAAGLVLACAALWEAGGCVAIPVSRKSIREEWAGEAVRAGEGVVTEAAAEAWAEGRGGGKVAVGVKGRGEREWKRERPMNRVEVVKWKWISAGAFPGMAESIFRSRRSLRPLYGERYAGKTAGGGVEAPPTKWALGGILPSWLFWTPVAAPFELLGFVPNECGSHHWGGTNAVLLTKFSAIHRKEIGAWTWWDDPELAHQRPTKSGYTHYMLAGFHRYCTYTVGDVERVGTKEAGAERERRAWAVTGPYIVDVGIPASKWVTSQPVPAGREEVEVALPPGARGRVELLVRVRVDPKRLAGEPDGLRRAILAAAHSRKYRLVVQVRE